MTNLRSYGDACGVARALDVVGERWALLVVRELLLGPKRFNDLLAGLAGASPNIVTQRLRDLADYGVIHRRDLGPPAHVHVYELTGWGRELEPVLLQLGRWGARAPLPAGADLGVDSLLLSLKAAFDPTRAPAQTENYEVDVEGDRYSALVSEGKLALQRGHTEDARASLAVDRETLRDIIAGRTTAQQARRSGRLQTRGPAAVVTGMLRVLLGPFGVSAATP